MKKTLINILINVLWLIGATCFIVAPISVLISDKIYNNYIIEDISPIEDNKIDTLYITRDSLIIKVEYIKTTEYDTIKKIYSLDDTASIKLFYELVSE